MSSGLQVGFSRVDITPPESCPLMGYTQRTDLHGPGNEGTLDPLYARILVFAQEGTAGVLVSFDLCILEDPAADALRSSIAAEMGIPHSQVMVSATHTHSGPYPWSEHWACGAREFVPDDLRGGPSQDYWPLLLRRVRQGVSDARADLYPARLQARSTRLGFAYNRRVKTENGIAMCWNPKTFTGPPPSPATDDTLVLLEVKRPQGSLLLLNLAGHPVVLGKESNQISADWPGAFCRQMEASGSVQHACFLHGAGADTHPWLATDDHPGDLDRVAAPVSALTRLLLASAPTPMTEGRLRFSEQHVELSQRTVLLSVWRFGELRFLGVPGELFGASGAQLREACPGPLMLATTTNGWTGYLPPENVFDEGGYELDAVKSFGLQRGDTEKLVETAISLLKAV